MFWAHLWSPALCMKLPLSIDLYITTHHRGEESLFSLRNRGSGCGDRQPESIFAWECELLMSGCQHWAPHGSQWSSACHGLFLKDGVTAQPLRKAHGLQWLKLWFRKILCEKLHWHQSFVHCIVLVRKINNWEYITHRKRTQTTVGRTKENRTYSCSSLYP